MRGPRDALLARAGPAEDEDGHVRARHLAEDRELERERRRRGPQRRRRVLHGQLARSRAPHDEKDAAALHDVAVVDELVGDADAVHEDPSVAVLVDDPPAIAGAQEPRVDRRQVAVGEAQAAPVEGARGAALDRHLRPGAEREDRRGRGEVVALERDDEGQILAAAGLGLGRNRIGAV